MFFDVGVRNALLGLHRSKPTPTERGLLFEHWFILQCIYYIRVQHLPWRVLAYRTDGGAEVDLVLDTRRYYVAIECKSGRQLPRSVLKGLNSFAEVADKPVKKFVIYQGERRQQLDAQTEAVPCLEFLLQVLPKLK